MQCIGEAMWDFLIVNAVGSDWWTNHSIESNLFNDSIEPVHKTRGTGASQ